MSSSPIITHQDTQNAPQAPNITTPLAPPHPLDGNWHVHIGDKTYGPYTGHQIKEYIDEGRITPNSQILLVGMETWIRAGEDFCIGPLFREKSKLTPPPITAAPGATVVQVTNQIGSAHLLAGMELASAKSPGVALFLSFLLCGIGQIYNGQIGKGILMLLGCILLWLVFLGWIISIWSMVDAYQTAKRMNIQHARQLAAGLSV